MDIASISRRAPVLSVVMPVRNARPYLDQAIASILGQTHEDFEFVIGDDGSNDGSTELMRNWARRDRRIRLFERREGSGPVGSSNWVVKQAQGRLIARMDADDVAHPDRLRRQLVILDAHPDAVMVGSLYLGIDQEGRQVRERDLAALSRPAEIGAPFAHGSILFRRAAFEAAGGYREGTEYWEDLDLYLRLAGRGRILVLPEALYSYRFAETSGRLRADPEPLEASLDLMLACAESHRRGRDYGPLIAGRETRPAAKRLDPMVFRAINSRVWSGQRPGLLVRMLRRARPPLAWPALRIWAYMLWAEASPRSLRKLLQVRHRLRNRSLADRFPDGSPCEWQCMPIAPGRPARRWIEAQSSDLAGPASAAWQPAAAEA